jgi:uncharacterized delta-60 repeat protein
VRPRLEGLEDRSLLNAGALDAGFGAGGTVLTDFPGLQSIAVAGAALQPDDKIVIAGTTSSPGSPGNGLTESNEATWDLAVLRYNPDGSPDATFGTGGHVTGHFGSALYGAAEGVALQADGKILVAGYASPRYEIRQDFALARYNPDGSLDTGFGSGGTVLTDFGGAIDKARSVAVQADGKIVVAGFAEDLSSPASIGVARYNPDGSPDATFGSAGKVTTPTAGSGVTATVALKSDGRIVVVATYGHDSSDVNHDSFIVAQYDARGNLDDGFGSHGTVVSEPVISNTASGLAVQADGKLVLGGTTAAQFALRRYNAAGSPDAGFGSGGVVTEPPAGVSQDDLHPVAVQADGKVVAYTSFALARYNADGTADASFGTGGKVPPTGTGSFPFAGTLLVQPDGNIVGVGYRVPGAPNLRPGIPTFSSTFTFWRCRGDGSLDGSFGTGGQVTATVTGPSDSPATGVAVQADGKVVVVGSRTDTTGFAAALARYNADGTPDGSFGSGGQVVTPGGGAAGVALEPDGKIVVARSDFAVSQYEYLLAVSRYNRDGTLDTGFGTGGTATAFFNDGRASAGAVAVQADGKIVVVGTIRAGPFPPSLKQYETYAVARFNADGSPDGSFGADGRVQGDLHGEPGSSATGIVIREDGKILVTGSVLLRLNPDGSQDTTFLIAGVGSAPPLPLYGTGIALDAYGRILVAGLPQSQGPHLPALVRYNPDGSPDSTFGSGGGTLDFRSYRFDAAAVAVEASGRILVAGTRLADVPAAGDSFVLFRVNADGSPDAGFGTSGQVVTPFGPANDRAAALALQPDGKIVAAGSSEEPALSRRRHLALGRYLGADPTLRSPNERFVAQVYRDVLHREADPTGMSYFTGLLDTGQADRSQVVLFIEASPECRTLAVQQLYQQFLGRPAEAGGLTTWLNYLAAGATVEQVAAQVLGSAEYYALHGGTHMGFLEALYHDVLGRSMDDVGRSAWGGAMDQDMPSAAVAALVLNSPEQDGRQVQQWYNRFLQRPADALGYDAFTGALQAGTPEELAVAAVLGSPEYMTKT